MPTDTRIVWIQQLTKITLVQAAKAEGKAKVREEAINRIHDTILRNEDELKQSFDFKISVESKNAVLRFFGARDTIGTMNEKDSAKELDVYDDLEAGTGQELDERDEEMARRLEEGVATGKVKVEAEVIQRFKKGAGQIKDLLRQMEEAVDADGARLFSDEEIAETLFKPLVRQGLIPEGLVPDKYSDVAAVFKGASEAYVERLREKTESGEINDTKRKALLAAGIVKDLADIALDSTKLVATCGGPGEAVKYVAFAKQMVTVATEGMTFYYSASDADSLLEAMKKGCVSGIKTFVPDATLRDILSNSFDAGFTVCIGARKAIMARNPEEAMCCLGDTIFGIFSAVAADKDEDKKKQLEEIGFGIKVALKGAGPAIGGLKDFATGEAGASKAVLTSLQKSMGKIGAELVAKQVGDFVNKKAEEDAEGKDEDEAEKIKEEGARDADSASDDASEQTEKGVEGIAAILQGIKDKISGPDADPKLLDKIAAASKRSAASGESMLKEMEAGVIDDRALEVAWAAAGAEEPEEVADTGKETVRKALDEAEKKIADLARGGGTIKVGKDALAPDAAFVAVFKQRIGMDPAEYRKSVLEKLSATSSVEKPAEENEGADKVIAFCRQFPPFVEAQLKLANADAQTRKAMEERVDKKRHDDEVAKAEKLMADDGDLESYREGLALAGALPTDPDALAEAEAEKLMDKIRPMIAQLKADQDLLEIALTVTQGGMGVLKNFLPPAEIAEAALAMTAQIKKAIKRQEEYVLWRENKLDAKSAASVQAEAFLNKMNIADTQRTRALILAGFKLIEMIAAFVELAGIASPGVQAAAKAVKESASIAGKTTELIYKIKTEKELSDAWAMFQDALENPKSRRRARLAIRKNPTLAKYAIAYGAVVANDPVARKAMIRCGLNDKVLEDADTNVSNVVEYLEALYPEDPVLEREVPTSKWFPNKTFEPSFKEWSTFVSKADPAINPKDSSVAKIGAVFGHLEKARKAFQDCDADFQRIKLDDRTRKDVDRREEAIQDVLWRCDELYKLLTSTVFMDKSGKRHPTMKDAATGFAQSINKVKVEFKKLLNENESLFIPKDAFDLPGDELAEAMQNLFREPADRSRYEKQPELV